MHSPATEALSNKKLKTKPNTGASNLSTALDVFDALDIEVWLPRQQLTGNVSKHSSYSLDSAYSNESGRQPKVEIGANKVLLQNESRAADLSALLQSDSSRSSPQHSFNKPNRAGVGSINGSNTGLNNAMDQAPALEWLCLFYKDWLFVDDVTGSHTVKSVYTDWMQSLLFSLGLYSDEQAQAFKAEPPIRRIKWPPTQGLEKSLATSKAHGAQQREVLSDKSKEQYVAAWFERQRGLLGREINFIVLMGKEPQDTLLAGGDSLAARDNLADQNSNSGEGSNNKNQKDLCLETFPAARVVLVPSSQEIWAQPDKKKQLWNVLADLQRKANKC